MLTPLVTIASHTSEVPTEALYAAIVALAGAVAVVWKFYSGRQSKHEDSLLVSAKERDRIVNEHAIDEQRWDTERAKWDVERAEMREIMERHHREVIEDFLIREEAMRKDFADRIERISEEAAKSSKLVVAVLNKIHDRFLGPRRAR